MDEKKSLLDDIGEFDVVSVFNPMSEDFTGHVARAVSTSMMDDAVTKVAREKYGVELNNPNKQTMTHVIQDITIKAGHTLNVPGPVAKVVVRQLVKEIAQRTGRKREMANPEVIKEIESQVIARRKSMLETAGVSETVHDRLNRQIEALNEDNTSEQAFPDQKPSGESDNNAGTDDQGAGEPKGFAAKINRAAPATEKKSA